MKEILHKIKMVFLIILSYVFRLFPLKNKVVATTMRGRKYDDNPKYILEYLHKVMPELELVWIKDRSYAYDLPDYIREISYYGNLWIIIKKVFELSTAKVFINTHHLESYIKKRKGQLFIQTWHGTISIKKLEGDYKSFLTSKFLVEELKNTIKETDVFISSSSQSDEVYRRAFGYEGPIFQCGYPRNDIFFLDNTKFRNKICETYHITPETKIALYVPTFRNKIDWNDISSFDVYKIEANEVRKSLEARFGGKWTVMVKWHPTWINHIKNHKIVIDSFDQDATSYGDIQELLCAADCVITDYSSSIFDAALRRIPCFLICKDHEQYTSKRGTYFKLEELPFPLAYDSKGLSDNILHFDPIDYNNRWAEFLNKVSIYDKGTASKDVSERIIDYINGKQINWSK